LYFVLGRKLRSRNTSKKTMFNINHLKKNYNRMFYCQCGSSHRFTERHKDAIINHLMFDCDEFVLQNPYAFLAEYFEPKKSYGKF
jgi:hypothetical protein